LAHLWYSWIIIVRLLHRLIQTDTDTYMVSEKLEAVGFTTAGGQEADAYEEQINSAPRNMHVRP